MTARQLPVLLAVTFAAGGLSGLLLHWHNARRLRREVAS